MEKFVYFSDDSKDSICSQSLKEKINQVSRRLEFELEDTAVEPCYPQCSQSTTVNNLQLGTHQDQEKSAKCNDPTSPNKINQGGSFSQGDTEQSTLNSKHTLPYGTRHLFFSNQLMLHDANSASSTLSIGNIHRPWERSTMPPVSESRTKYLQNSEIRWLLEDSKVLPSQNFTDGPEVLGQSLIAPPAEFCDDNAQLLKKTWSLPPSDEPLDLSTKNKANTSGMAVVDARGSERTQSMVQQGKEQSRLNVNHFSGEMTHHEVDQTLIKKSYSSTAVAQDTPELLHESQIKQSLSMLEDEADETQYPANTSVIQCSVSTEVSAPENTEIVSQIPDCEIKEDNSICGLPYRTENDTDGIEKDSEDTVQNAWAFLNEEPLPVVDSTDDASLSSHDPTNNVYSLTFPSSATQISQNAAICTEPASPESSALPSFTFLRPNKDSKGSSHNSHAGHRNVPQVYNFESDDNNELPSLTFHRPRSQCDDMVANNPDLLTTKIMDFSAEQDSLHYTADVSKTQLSVVEVSGDSANLKNKQINTGSLWSVKSAVQSLTTPSIKIKFCKINNTSNQSQPADINTAFVTTASSTSENSYAPHQHSSRVVEGQSHCDESTIVSISPPEYKALSSVVSCPSTPEVSSNCVPSPHHHKLPAVIRRPVSSRTSVQASSTPRQKTVCAESAKPKTFSLAKDNQNLLRIAMKNKLSSNCQGSESILNLGFSKDAQAIDKTESGLGEGKTKAIITTQDVTEDTKKPKGKHPKKSLFKSLKRQLLCGNPEISMMSSQNETVVGTCFNRPLAKPVQYDVKKQSPTKRPNLAIPHCAQGTTSTATLAFVTLNRTSQSSNIPTNSWCKHLETKMSPKLAANSKAGTIQQSPQNRSEDIHLITGQKEQIGTSSSASIGTSTSSLSTAVKTTVTQPLLQNEIEKESQIKKQSSSSGSTAYKKDQNSTKYVTLVPKLFGDDTSSRVKDTQSNSPARKLELNISDNSPLHKLKKTVAKKSLTPQSEKTIDTECPPRNLNEGDSELFKLPMDPEKYLIMRREQKRQRHCHQSSSSSDTSITSLRKKRAGTLNTELGCEKMETVMAREVGRITAEWLATFMSNSNMRYFQSRYEDENSKQVLLYLCRQCCIKVTESDTDPALITVTKSRCSRSPTEHDVRRLVRRTRRQ